MAVTDAQDFVHHGPEVYDAMTQRDEKIAELEAKLAEAQKPAPTAEESGDWAGAMAEKLSTRQSDESLESPPTNVIQQFAAGYQSQTEQPEPSAAIPVDPADLASAITEAEAEGDWYKAMQAKLRLAKIPTG